MALISSRQTVQKRNHGPQSSFRADRVRAMAATFLLATLALAARSAGAQALSPGGPVDFGSTPVGNTSTSITLTFTANTTTTVTAITAVTDGALNQDFNVVGQSCLGTLSPPASCLITLNFKPSQIGLRKGELLITDGTGAYANQVPLHGVGQAAQVVFSPATSTALTSIASVSPAVLAPSSALYDGAGDLFVLDSGNNRLLEQTAAQVITGEFSVVATFPALSSLSSLAIAGDGTLFVSSPSTGTVYSIAPGGLPVPLVIGASVSAPAGLATDGYGYLYISDNVANRLLRVALDGSGTAAFSLNSLSLPLSGPAGLGIATDRSLYIADRGNNRIVRVSLNTGVATALAASGVRLNAPQGVAVDAAGAVYVADAGSHQITMIDTAGSAVVLPVSGPALVAPAGVLVQANGDLLVADSAAGLVSLGRTAAGVTFPTTTKVGTTDSSDGELAITVQNTGSYPLNLTGTGSAPSISTGAFSVAADSTCPVLPSTSTSVSPLALSRSCVYQISFRPIKKDRNDATLNLALNGVGGTGASGVTTATAALAGTGYTVLDHFALVAGPNPVQLGAPLTVTVTAVNNDGSTATDYTGTANFTSTDASATFPGNARTYTFTAADAGVHTFPATAGRSWVFGSVGTFTISASTLR